MIDVGPAFASQSFSAEAVGPRLLRGDNVAQGRLRWDGARYWPSDLVAGYETYELRERDVILAMDRPWIEAGLKQAVVRASDLPALLVQRVARLRARPGIDQGFLRWLIAELRFTGYIRSVSTGSTVPHISQSQIADYPVPRLPDLGEQRAIADVLGALDDKIESNRRLAATLEELALATFDAAPKRATRLDVVATLTMGSSPPGSTYNEAGEGLPFYQGVKDFGFRSPSLRVWCSEPTRVAHPTDTLVAVRAPVGRVNRAGRDCAIGRGLAAVASTAPSTIYYALVRADAAWAPYNSEGTVFGAITASDLRAVNVEWPTASEATALEHELALLDSRLAAALSEADTLAELRDALLPELLSGRLRVGVAEELVESAT